MKIKCFFKNYLLFSKIKNLIIVLKKRNLHIILFFVFLSFSPFFAQRYNIDKFTSYSGKPIFQVSDIIQDSVGRIWISTESSVLILEGNETKIFDRKDGRQNILIKRLFVDNTGKVWSVNVAGNIVRSYLFEDGLPPNAKERVYFTLNRRKLFIPGFVVVNKVPIIAVNNIGIFYSKNNEIFKIGEKEGLKSLRINSLTLSGDSVFVVTDKGIQVIKNFKVGDFPEGNLNSVLNIVVNRKSGKPEWALTKYNLYRLLNGKWIAQLEKFSGVRLRKPLHALSSPWFGKIFFGDRFNLFVFDLVNKKLTQLSEENGFLPGGGERIFVDNDKNVWVGNYYGISKLNSFAFSIENGLFSKEKKKGVTALSLADSSHVVAAVGSGLYSIDVKNFKVKNLSENLPPFTRIMDIAVDEEGNIHLAILYKGFGLIDKKGNFKWEYKISGKDRLALAVQNTKSSLYFLTLRNLWRKQGENIKKISHLPYGVVRNLYVENGSSLVITSSTGLVKISNGKERVISAKPSASNLFSYLKTKNYGELVGGIGGVFCVKGDSLVAFQPKNFNVNGVVYSILQTPRNDLWFGTNNGVFRYTGKRTIHYTSREGLAGAEMNRNALLVDANNKVWIGGEEGLSVFNYRFDKLNKTSPPKVFISGIESKRKKNVAASNFVLPFEDNELIFHINVITQDHPKEIKLYYRLNGYDKDWIKSLNTWEDEFRYTSLAPGKYVFEVKAVNFWGDSSRISNSPVIRIISPFYSCWWFFVIVFLIVVGIVVLIVKYFLTARQEKILEVKIEEATKEVVASREKYKQIFTNNQAILLIVDPKNSNILDANNQALVFYGYSLGEMRKLKFEEIDPSFENMKSLLGSEIKHTSYRSKHKLRNGKEIPVEVFIGFIKTDYESFIYTGVYDISGEEQAKSALMTMEEKYKALIENIQDGIFMIKDFKLVFVNNAVAKMLGREVDDVVGKDFSDFVPPEYRTKVRTSYLNRLKNENVEDEYILHLKDGQGKEFIANFHLSMIYLGDEKYIIGTMKDITDAYKAQKALEESEKQYRELFENSPVGIYRVSMKGEVILVNDVLINMLGYSSLNELNEYYKAKKDFYPENEMEKFVKTLREKGQIKGFEHRLVKKDGKKIYVRQSAWVYKNSNGEITYIEGIVEDITFVKKTIERLKASEERSSRILETIPDPIFELSPAGKILNVKNWELFEEELSFSELIGEQFENLLPKDYVPKFRKVFRTAYRTREITKMNISYEDANEFSHFELRFLKIDNASVLVLFRDITEIIEYEYALLKAKEAAERSDRLKSEFLAQMSHEIRTPLNAILSFSQLIEEECRDKVGEEFLTSFESIQRGGQRLLNTIELILLNSEIQAGTYEKTIELFSLGSILQDIITDKKITAERKGLKIIFEKKIERTFLWADKFTVNQIFLNLIDNAIKYTKKGYVKVTIYEKGLDSIFVDIEDTGIGIDKEFIPHLFDPFSQEDTGYTRKFEGTGLGLSLVKKYVELNDGEILVESNKGKGTKFTIILPKKTQNEDDEN